MAALHPPGRSGQRDLPVDWMGVREEGSPGPWSEQVGWRRLPLEWAGREWLGRSSPGKPWKFPGGGRWRGSRVDAASHGRRELTVLGRCAQRRPGHPGAWLCSHWGSEPGGELGYRDTLKKEQAA